MLVAFSTSNGAYVDMNLLDSSEFSVWDINSDEAYYVSRVSVEHRDGQRWYDKASARAEALRHCSIVCAAEISGPAAARLISHGVHPMKTWVAVPVEDVITRLQEVLRGSPAPWITKTQMELAGGN